MTPTLNLDASLLCGAPVASLVFGSGPVTPPTVSAAGGFTAYRPLASLAPRSSAVIVLAP